MATVPAAVRSPADADDPADLETRHILPSELGGVTVDTEGDQPRITVPISSTTPHRSDGKIMSEEALDTMAEQLCSGEIGLWDDHGLSTLTGWREYRREDMFGRWVDGDVDENGVLWGTAELMPDREETATLLEQLAQDMPVGFSVGYKPLEEEMLAVGDEDEKTRHIYDVDLWETSPVGIPDNPAAIASVAAEIDRADVDVGPELASTIAVSVREGLESAHMSDASDTDSTDSGTLPDEGDPGTDPDGEQSGPPEAAFTDSEVEEIMGIVGGALESGLSSTLDEVEQELQNVDGGDGDDSGDDGDEESASATPAGIDEVQDRLDELEQRNEKLEQRLEEKETTIERLESETRESAGRKGISPGASGESGPDDGDGGEEAEASSSNRPDNVLDEAMRLGGN